MLVLLLGWQVATGTDHRRQRTELSRLGVRMALLRVCNSVFAMIGMIGHDPTLKKVFLTVFPPDPNEVSEHMPRSS